MKFGNNEIDKRKSHYRKDQSFLVDVDIEKILLSN